MKKTIYIAAALMALAGCSKSEIAPETTGGVHDITVSVKVADGDTKAVFDGDSHIKFESGDAFYAGVAKADAPTAAIKVASKAGYEANQYYSTFKIDDCEAEEPSFSGSLYSIVDADFADSYILYGVFPSSQAYGSADLTKWSITLPDAQASTQSSWSGKADVMVAEPTLISTSVNTHDDKYGEYTMTNNGEKIRFAHIFGFGKIKFAGFPEEYSDLVVKSVKIETTDSKYIAGKYTVDITKDAEEIVAVEGASYNMKNCISLQGDGTTTVADYTAWFVANPGTYNVKITVTTGKADFIFEREGLVIKRGVIAEPTVNYKGTDTVVSHDVTIAEGASWSMSKFSWSSCISSGSKAWGDDGMEKMNFYLTFPNGEKDAAGSYLSGSGGVYKQKLATVKVSKLVLASEAYFHGMKAVKMNLGINTADVTADFTVSVVNGSETVELGKVTVAGNNSSIEGQNYYFNTTDDCRDGALVLTVDNFSTDEKYCIPYLGSVVINPAPEIILSETVLKVEKAAGTTGIDCTVKAATGDPTVTVAEDAASWLGASYADGKINVTVTENTGAKRVGTITVKATGFAESTAEITITQKSATAVEYTLTVTAADVKDAIDAALDGAEATDDYIPLTASFNAVSADGKTYAVPVTFTYINYAIATDEYFTVASKTYSKLSEIKCTSAVGEISKFVVVADCYSKASTYAECCMQFSSDGKTWGHASASYVQGEDGYYTSTALNEDETKTWFNIKTPDWVKYLKVKSFAVTFVAD